MITQLEKHKVDIDKLCQHYMVKRLEVFGSATDKNKFDPKKSDIDFLVDFVPEAEPQLAGFYLDLIDDLQKLLERNVGVVMTRAIRSPDFKQVINQSRTTIYAA